MSSGWTGMGSRMGSLNCSPVTSSHLSLRVSSALPRESLSVQQQLSVVNSLCDSSLSVHVHCVELSYTVVHVHAYPHRPHTSILTL